MNIQGEVTVVIATRCRPTSLARCIASLQPLGSRVREILVVDDGSPVPLASEISSVLATELAEKTRWFRFETQRGIAAGRNLGVQEARTSLVLQLDDDAVWLSTDVLDMAVRTILADPTIFAVAFAQAGADGVPFPPTAQPAPVAAASYVASYIGFAHLVRRDVFQSLGGYREAMVMQGEERELCLRALDAGYHVIYLPDARVAHLVDPAGRDARLYLHRTVHGGVLDSIYNDPLPLLLVRIPVRLRAYSLMRRGLKLDDPGGMRSILAWIGRDLRGALVLRRPVRWRTIRRWRELTRRPPPYGKPA